MATFASPDNPINQEARKAYEILRYAHESAESFLATFDQERGGRRGAGTDEQQDLLRAMLVFAGAGLDSMTKRLIEDALPSLVEHSASQRQQLERLVARHFRGSPADVGSPGDGLAGDGGAISPTRMARILMSDNPRGGLTSLLVEDLTAGSLQSAAELYRVGGYLGFTAQHLAVTEQQLREVFDCRNKVIHEMDINFDAVRRNRNRRLRDDMVRYTQTLFTAGKNLLARVDANLS